MIGLGIMGEYLGRVFTEVKRRPNYLGARSARLRQEDALSESGAKAARVA